MADRYWVGGTGNTNDTAHWSDVSGGAGGFSVPTSADNAIFDAASNATAYTVTVNAAFNCLDLSLAAAPSGSGTITLSGSGAVSCYGSLLLLAGMTWSFTGLITFKATSTGKTITTNGVMIACQWVLRFDGVGGEWVLQDDLTHNCVLMLSAGHLNTNSKTVTGYNVNYFGADGSATKVLTLGASVINENQWSLSGGSLTINAGTSVINITSGTSPAFGGVAATYATVNFPTINGTVAFGSADTFGSLNLVGAATKVGLISLAANQTVTGTLTITGNSATNRLLVQSNTIGTPRTITAAAVSLTNVDFMDIVGAGAASPFTGTSIGDCLGNSGITFTPSATQYWKTTTTGTKTWSTAANWFLATNGGGGAGRVPLPQDDVVFDANSIGAASTTVSADMPRLGKNITWTGVTNAPTFTVSVATAIYGSLTYASGMTITITNLVLSMSARSSVTITSAGTAVQHRLGIAGPGGVFTLQDAFTSSRLFLLYYGTFDANGFNVTVSSFDSNSPTTRTLIMGSGTWTLTTIGTAWFIAAGTLTITPGTSTIKFTDATASSKTFAGGGKTYNNIWLSGAGSGAFIFTGSNTFNDFRVDSLPKNIQFTAGTTTTVASWTGPAYDKTAVKFAQFPNITGSNIETLDSPANSIAGDIALVWYGAPETWGGGGGSARILISKWNVGSYQLRKLDSGLLRFQTTGANSVDVTSSVAVPFTIAGSDGWVAVSWAADNGAVGSDAKFWTSTDGISWAQLGSTRTTAGVGTINDTVDRVEIATGGNRFGSYMGKVYRAQVYNGIPPIFGGAGSASPVVDFNPNDWVSGNTWVSSTTGETWTRNGSALLSPETKISSVTSATHTLAKSGGGIADVSRYGNITYSIASPASTFYAGAKGINGGNTTNWVFNNAPALADLAATDDADALAAASANAIAANSNATDEAESVVSAALLAILASASIQEGSDVLSCEGTIAVGAGAVSNESEALLSIGAAGIVAALSVIDDDDTLAADGYVWAISAERLYEVEPEPRVFDRGPL